MNKIINWLALIWIKAKHTIVSNKSAKLVIEKDVSLMPDVKLKGNITIKKGTYVNSLSRFISGPNSSIVIGEYCEISYNVNIWGITHSSVYSTGPDQILIEKDVVIGNHVWIGANAFIKEGITIGSNVVIGANSVVTKDIPDNAIVGGVPAKLIKLKSL